MNKLFVIIMAFSSQLVWANEVEVVNIKLINKSGNSYRVDVSLLHGDTGWDHYADAWEIYDNNKKLIATRVLHHPHVAEQPFTRSLYDVTIPAGVKTVYVRGHDKVHGNGKFVAAEVK